MGISQPQNLRIPPIEKLRPYGVRVSLPSGDPFRKLLGPEWHRIHWFPSPEERDAALAEMSRRHQYSRATDKPSLVFEKVEKLAEPGTLKIAPGAAGPRRRRLVQAEPAPSPPKTSFPGTGKTPGPHAGQTQ